jgi:hypothetical protein
VLTLLLLACSGSGDDTAASTCTNGNAHSQADAPSIDGGSGSGDTCPDGTADWWAFTVSEPGWYNLGATASDSDAARVLFTVVDPDGNPWTVAQYQPGDTAYYLASAGTWYVKVDAPGVESPVAYTVAPSPTDGATATEDDALALSVEPDIGVRLAVALEDGADADAVSFTAPASTWLTVRKDPIYQAARMSDVTLTFLDAEGTPLTQTMTSDSSYAPVEDAAVQLSVAAAGSAGWTGVELRVGETWTGATEPNESEEEAMEFVDELYMGRLADAKDQDWFHTTITKDGFLGVYCAETVAVLDAVDIEVWDSSGQVTTITEEYEADWTPGADAWVRLTGAVTGPGAWYSCELTTVRPPSWEGE